MVAVLSIIGTACSPDSASSTTESAGATTTTADSSTTTSAANTPTTTEPRATTTVAAATGGAECLVGMWSMNSDSFFTQMMEMLEGELQGASFVHTGGSYTVEFGADGTMKAVRDMWSFEVETPEGTLIQTIDSQESGTYQVDGNTMSAELNQDSFEIKSQVEVDGQLLDLPTQSVDLPDNTVDPAGEFSCDSNTMSVSTPEGMSIVFDRS